MLYEVDIEHARGRFNPYVNHGGTVVAVAGDDFVVVGGDTRLSEGYSIVTRNESKLVQLTDKTILATSGMFADFCELTKVLRIVFRSLRLSLRSMTSRSNDSHPLNQSLIFSRKPSIPADSSPITPLT